MRSVTDQAVYSSVVVCAGCETARLARVACLQDSSSVFGEVDVYATPLPGTRNYSVGLSGVLLPRHSPVLVVS